MRRSRCIFSSRAACVAALAGLSLGGSQALANPPQDMTILQYFELEWDDMERRVPDVFVAGYDGLWVPPPSMAATFKSPGYDPFDRFDLGSPPLLDLTPGRARTTYGTEATLRAMLAEMHRANVLVYADGIFNHNSQRTTSDAFLEEGGWPGFWIPRENPPRNKFPTDDWGDFNNGNAFGYLQSENPGGGNYNLEDGDLVALVDIRHQDDNQFIRQPVGADAANIPPGTVRNLPDAANARFYPDLSLPPVTFTNPGTPNNPGSQQFTFYPWNTADPVAGDAISENSTAYLMRWARWMVQEVGFDGFRLDAYKHMPTFFGDTFLDAALHEARTDAFGNQVNAFTFGENISGNFQMLNNYVRKDSFANRDTLDIQGSARLRDLLNAGGFGTWNDVTANADSAPIDNADDGFVNGSVGINHVFSHDNGTVGDGGSQPPLPTARQQGLAMHAYMLMRPGRGLVYHNARGVSPTVPRFNPREGVPAALGNDPSGLGLDDAIINLMYARNQVGFGQYFELNANKSDVIIFERALGGRTNSVTAASDRWDAGFTDHTVFTQYPQGTRLHEMTGNAADPLVDPGNDIPSVLTVGAGGQLNIRVPNNSSFAAEHGRGYLVYAEALPSGTLSFPESTGTIAPDPVNLPDFFRRLTETPIVSTPAFTIRLETTQTDPLDDDVDDNAVFRWGAGNQDYNGNGSIDISPGSPVIGGYEQFVTTNQPLFGNTPGGMGLYEQVIDASQLDEGFNYLSVIAFKRRPAGTTPIFREWRTPVYVDLLPPVAGIAENGMTFSEGDDRPELRYITDDRTVVTINSFLNLDPGEDPAALANALNAARRYDRMEWRRTFDESFVPGENTITLLVTEESGRTSVIEQTVFYDVPLPCPADLSGDGNLNNTDINQFINAFLAQLPAADFNQDGNYNNTDINLFISAFLAGCN